MTLHVQLVARLRRDAAAVLTRFLRVQGAPPVLRSEILTGQTADGRWFARVNPPEGGWLAGYAGDSCPSEVEALCSLIERARADTERAGGIPPLHLLDQLEDDEQVLAIYRTLTRTLLRNGLSSVLGALDELDHVAEASDLSGALDELDHVAEASDLSAEMRGVRAAVEGVGA